MKANPVLRLPKKLMNPPNVCVLNKNQTWTPFFKETLGGNRSAHTQ
jgi:hypothetical protein